MSLTFRRAKFLCCGGFSLSFFEGDNTVGYSEGGPFHYFIRCYMLVLVGLYKDPFSFSLIARLGEEDGSPYFCEQTLEIGGWSRFFLLPWLVGKGHVHIMFQILVMECTFSQMLIVRDLV